MKISLQGAVIFLSVFLLGLPFNGVIPEPPALNRDFIPEPAPDAIQALVWATIYFSAGVFFARRALTGTFNGPPAVLAILVALYSFSGLWSPVDTPSISIVLQVIGSMLLAMVASMTFQDRKADFILLIGAALHLNLLINLIFILALPDETVANGRWSGLAGNPNYLGSLAVAGLVCTLSLSYLRAHTSSIWKFACLAVSLIVLYGSASITSWVAAFAVLWLHLFSLVSARRWGSSAQVGFSFLSLGVLIAFLFSSVAVDLLDLAGRDSTASGRTLIWGRAMGIIADRPLLGYGLGANTLNTGVLHWNTHFHNGLVQLAVAVGYIGACLFIAHIFLIVTWVFRSYREPSGRALALALLCFVIYNITEAPIFLARSPVWILYLYFLVVMLPSRYRLVGKQRTFRSSKLSYPPKFGQ